MELALAIFVIISIGELIAIIFLKKDKNELEEKYYLAKYNRGFYGRKCFEAGIIAGAEEEKYKKLTEEGYASEAGIEDTKLEKN